ncbi:SDR family NAD(P)-dependent oxidoreductase [Mesobacillus foraminis]|uniref:3-oxoacyl-[acyl-carrier protein] reductase n=1 Tax=Mesobacillus foraminis TaxID=279826 RepID=A0A4R2B385_9BACI|nr:SDR family NAD(P)-dependent oxidoreductase [Mesobacillus foraminis]TCN21097.1 3-oxoacyl-[acyl-carrier protein] reductase [Mesobacillus foraminis]
MRLEGRVALITGAARGLGFTMAETLAKEGAAVVVNDLDGQLVEEAVTALRDKGAKADGFAANVTNKEQVISMVDHVMNTFGRLDILVNNAGGALRTPKKLEDITEEDWDLVLDVNLKGTFLVSQAAVPVMKEQGGSIINLSSIGGRTASIVTGVSYAAAKAGVVGFTRRLAKEVGPYGIRVNAIAPGLVLSGERLQETWDHMPEGEQAEVLDAIPLRRLGSIQEMANAITFLASGDSSYMTGSVLDVNGGRFMG